MSDGPDLSHFVQHLQLDAYEQSMARQGYAYGVDLRRSRWLASSTVGNTLVRAVDRAWPGLAGRLEAEVVVDSLSAPTTLLRELVAHMGLLRTPTPTVKLLRPDQRGRWPMVTPLGATRGGASWLILDAEALLAIPAGQRAFMLASGLGHLQCDHAVFYSAHLLANRGEGNLTIKTVRSLMTPWTKVMIYSADRAGLIACGQLDTAVSVIENPPIPLTSAASHAGADPDPRWLPSIPPPTVRIQALEEFARSAVFARVSAMRARQRELARNITLLEPRANGSEPTEKVHVPADAWSLARVDARLTDRLSLL